MGRKSLHPFLLEYSVIFLINLMAISALSGGWKVSLTLIELDHDPSCVMNCHSPRFEMLVNSSMDPSEFIRNWQLESVQMPERPWTIPMTFAEAKLNWTLGGAINGKDHTYGFPRVCADGAHERLMAPNTDANSAIIANRLVYLNYGCLNATILLRWTCCGDRSLCPKGMEPELGDPFCFVPPPPVAETSKLSENEYFEIGGITTGNQPVPMWIIFIVGGVAVVLLIIVVILTTVLFGQRCRSGKSTPGSSLHSVKNGSGLKYRDSAVIRRVPSDSSGKYDVPWDQKFRPLPDYVRVLANGSPLPLNVNNNQQNYNNNSLNSHHILNDSVES